MQPIDYSSYLSGVKTPVESFFSGQRQGLENQLLRQSVEQNQAKLEMARQQQEAAMQQQKMLSDEIVRFVNNPNKTTDDYERIALLADKDKVQNMLKVWEKKPELERQNVVSRQMQTVALLTSENPQLGIESLRKEAQAQLNSGNEQVANIVNQIAEKAKVNPSLAADEILIGLSAYPEGQKAVANLLEQRKSKREEELQPLNVREKTAETLLKETQAKFAPEKFGAELNLTKAQIEQAKASSRASNASAAKTSAEASRMQAETNQIVSGIIPAEKRPEAEAKFRKEYSEQTKNFQEVKEAYNRTLSAQPNAVGDISLIFSYMKMLDPASVVREGEFATAQNAGGIDDKVRNLYNKTVNGQRLTDSQRNSFKGQAEKLYKAAGERESVVRDGIGRIAKGYGLNTDNIFYTQTETTPMGGGGANQQQKTQMPTGFKVLR